MEILNINLIAEFLNIDDFSKISLNDDLDDYEWDSLSIVLIQSHFSELNGKEIDPDDLSDFETIKDLDHFISSNL
jgi:acyl carrier protein